MSAIGHLNRTYFNDVSIMSRHWQCLFSGCCITYEMVLTIENIMLFCIQFGPYSLNTTSLFKWIPFMGEYILA